VPLVLVNGTAVIGQIGWAADHLGRRGWPLAANSAVAVLFAATVESIAVYLAAEAHAALLARDPALKLRLSSYVVALVIGALNFSHYAPGWRPNAEAVTFGLLSTLSPWLWAIRSRSANRDALRTAELIDRRSARFAFAKWLNFPGRTWRAYRLAVDTGETRERYAWEASRPAVSPAAPVPLRVVPPSRSRSVPAGSGPSRRAVSPKASRTVPAVSSRPSRTITSRTETGTAYAGTLAQLRRRYPSTLPSVDEVFKIDGRSRSRAGRIRQRLAEERAAK
jgi:hypothetical protein